MLRWNSTFKKEKKRSRIEPKKNPNKKQRKAIDALMAISDYPRPHSGQSYGTKVPSKGVPGRYMLHDSAFELQLHKAKKYKSKEKKRELQQRQRPNIAFTTSLNDRPPLITNRL